MYKCQKHKDPDSLQKSILPKICQKHKQTSDDRDIYGPMNAMEKLRHIGL